MHACIQATESNVSHKNVMVPHKLTLHSDANAKCHVMKASNTNGPISNDSLLCFPVDFTVDFTVESTCGMSILLLFAMLLLSLFLIQSKSGKECDRYAGAVKNARGT